MGREDDLVVAQTNKKEKNKEPWRKFLNFFFWFDALFIIHFLTMA